jgi:hypothetical protein
VTPQHRDSARLTALVRWGVFAFLAGIFSTSCGYSLRGSGSFLPVHIKTIAIPMFKNATTRFELDLKLTQAVINEFVVRGKVSVVSDPENVDAVLEGEVTGFFVSPIAFSGSVGGSADRYSITISASVILRDVKTKTAIFSNPSYVYQTEYQVPQGSDFESSETDALVKIAELFARNLVIAILEGF